MRRASAFYRLIDRSWGFWLTVLFILLGPAIMTLSFGGSLKDAVDVLRSMPDFLWGPRHAVAGRILMMYPVVGFVAGNTVGDISARARKTWIGWTLPGLRRGLVTGNLQVMAIGILFTMTISGGLTMRSLAAAGVAAVFYALGLAANTWANTRLTWFFVLVLWTSVLSEKLPTYLRPGTLFDAVVSINAPLVAILSIAGATWLVLRGLSPELHRREIPGLEEVTPKGSVFGRFILWLLGRGKPTFETPRPIRPGSLRDWLRALAETASPFGRSWIQRLIRTAVLTVAIGYTFNMLFLVAMPLIGIVGRETSVLAGAYIYPLSRKLRATVLYVATLKAVAFLAMCGLLATALLAWKPWPQFGFSGTPMTPAQALVRTGIALTLVPLLQWEASVPPVAFFWLAAVTGATRRNFFLRLIVLAALYVGSTMAYESYVFPSYATLGAVAIAGAIIAAQLLLFALLRRAYRTRDLV